MTCHPVKTQLFDTWGEFWRSMGIASVIAVPVWAVLALLFVLSR